MVCVVCRLQLSRIIDAGFDRNKRGAVTRSSFSTIVVDRR